MRASLTSRIRCDHYRGCTTLAVHGRVDAAEKVVQPGEDGLDEYVSRGRVRAAAVVGNEEGERVRGHVGQGAYLRQDVLRGGLEVGLAVGWVWSGESVSTWNDGG